MTALRSSAAETHSFLADTSILLDCRWLGFGGAGRVTEIVLRDFRDAPPPGRWTLWGDPARVEPLTFRGATVRRWKGDPRRWFGQRDFTRARGADVTIYAHQIRPLRPGRSIAFILDTIPLRHGGNAALRLAKRLFFSAAARLSSHVVTLSEHSRTSIERDLGVAGDRISILPLPVDVGRARAIASARDGNATLPVLLYVGRFDRHKNLGRLCRAFAQSAFAREGGRLLLVGGWTGEVDALRAWVDEAGIENVEVRGSCTERELDELYASSRALVLPSLEEGYGLPAFEAAACGLPVAASRTGAMATLPPHVAALFDPTNVAEIRDAVDDVVRRPLGTGWTQPLATPGAVVVDAVAAALTTGAR